MHDTPYITRTELGTTCSKPSLVLFSIHMGMSSFALKLILSIAAI